MAASSRTKFTPEMSSIPSGNQYTYYSSSSHSSDEDDGSALLLGSKKAAAIQESDEDGEQHFRSPAKQSGTNEVATFFNFAKASIGSGSFALPWGILQAGVIVGGFGMIYLGLLSVYTMQLMLECKQYVVRNLAPDKRKSLNYTELGRQAMGAFGKWAVDASVLLCNLGVCAGYMIFISGNLRWAFTCFAEKHSICFSTWEIYAIIVPILILLVYLPSFRLLAFAAYIGAVFLVVAMVVVYVYGGGHGFCASHDDDILYVPSNGLGLAQWFGVTAFLFCVHSMVIPLESTMKRPKNMPLVLDVAAITVVGVNLPFALYGYFLFGSDTQGYIFSNLPGGTFNDIVRLFLSMELTLTFPIVFKPAADVAEEILQNFLEFIGKHAHAPHFSRLYTSKNPNYKICRWAMIGVLRTFLVLISWGVAVGIPRFELCLALVGSLATTILAFILPPLFHLVLKWKIISMFRRILHLAILVFGIFATVTATSINLYMAISAGGGGTNCTVILQQCNANDTSDCK